MIKKKRKTGKMSKIIMDINDNNNNNLIQSNLIQLLREEIVEISAENPLNTVKLNEYIRMWERATSFEKMSVMEVTRPYGDHFIPQLTPVSNVRPYNNGTDTIGSYMDMIKEIAYDFKTPKRNEIDEYMYWISFIKALEKDIKKFDVTDSLRVLWDNEIYNFKYKLYERIFGLMKEKFEENIQKDFENKEKDLKDSDSKIVLNSVQTI